MGQVAQSIAPNVSESHRQLRVDFLQEVRDSQIAIGDHITVQTNKGTKVTVLDVSAAPEPQLRPIPIADRPEADVAILGREAEIAVASAASPASPVQLFGPVGIGKTALLRHLSHHLPKLREGVVYRSARRWTLDELELSLYDACWECHPPWVPRPQQIRQYLVDREVLVVLDNCEIDREDLEELLDTAPRSCFVVGSTSRTLWARGAARAVAGLSEEDGVCLIEQRLGALAGMDRDAAAHLVREVDGSPQRLVEAAARVADGTSSLIELADSGVTQSAVVGRQRDVIALLSLLDGAGMRTADLSEVTGIDQSELAMLLQHGVLKTNSPTVRLARPAERADDALDHALVDRLLAHFTAFVKAEPSEAVGAEVEAIVAALQAGIDRHCWARVLALARAAEVRLAPTGSWIAWRRVLMHGLDAARALDDIAAEAHMLHQLGSLDICIAEHADARERLNLARQKRFAQNDLDGVALTEHNLQQLDAAEHRAHGQPALTSHPTDVAGAGRAPERKSGLDWLPRPTIPPWLLLLVLAAAAAVAAVLLSPRKDNPASDNVSPAIAVVAPVDGASFMQGSRHRVVYRCADPPAGSGLVSCVGTVPVGRLLDTSRPGPATFTVVARDHAGNRSTLTVTYSVIRASRPSNP